MDKANSLKEKYLNKQRDLSQLGEQPPFPPNIKIDICNTCNYTCVFCPQAKQSGRQGFIDKELCKTVIRDAYTGGGTDLCLCANGEPLLNKDLEYYIAYAKDLGYKYIFLNSNGYLLTEDRAQRLVAAGLDSMKISFNAGAKSYQLVHGVDGFDRVVDNIKNFSAVRGSCKLYVSYVAVRQTKSEAAEVRELLEPYIDDFLLMNANNRGGSVTGIEEYLYAGDDEYSYQYPCSQLFNNAYVTSEGYMVICCQDFENLTVVADLNRESILSAWTNEKFTDFRRRYLQHELKGTLCQNCIYNTSEAVIPLTKECAYYPIDQTKYNNLLTRIHSLIQNNPEGKR